MDRIASLDRLVDIAAELKQAELGHTLLSQERRVELLRELPLGNANPAIP